MEWQHYFSEHGFTQDMQNWRAAMVAASNWNVTAMSAGSKNFQPLSPSDFLPKRDNVTREYSDDELIIMGEMAGGTRFEPNNS